jgi:hypothetical protein
MVIAMGRRNLTKTKSKRSCSNLAREKRAFGNMIHRQRIAQKRIGVLALVWQNDDV